MKENINTVWLLAIISFFIILMIAPVVEVTIKNSEDQVLMHSVTRMILSEQSLVPVSSIDAAKTEIKISKLGERLYYECEAYIPKSIADIKEHCMYVGTNKED